MTKQRLIVILTLATAVLAAVLAALEAWSAPQPTPKMVFRCHVVKVHDGDTANEVIVELPPLSVRYDDCWSPELDAALGQRAKLAAKEAEGKSGTLTIDLKDVKRLSDIITFGRVVGTIQLDGEEETQSEKMIRLKLASSKKGGVLGQ